MYGGEIGQAPLVRRRKENLRLLLEDAKKLNLPDGKLNQFSAFLLVKKRFPILTNGTQKEYAEVLCNLFNNHVDLGDDIE